jgi:phage tail sheath protein FI
MATSYKTPGVYIEEIAKFPPSVAEVETAIPVFVGHTRKADRIIPDDLKQKAYSYHIFPGIRNVLW